MGEKSGKKHEIRPVIATGFPYAFPYYFKVFDFLANKNDFVFILPKFWFAKEGKIRLPLEKKPGFKIYGLKAFSYGRKSLLGGIFKGWMPGVLFLLPYLKLKYKSRVLYSCSEPNLLTTLYNGIIAKMLGLKHILFTWQNVPPEMRMGGLKLKLSNFLFRLNLWLADGIICGSQKAESIIKNFNRQIRTLVCPISGVDTEKFRPGIAGNWREKLELEGKKVVLFCGALDERKGVHILFQALPLIPEKSVCAVVAGTGSQKEKLVDLANRLGVGKRVLLLDWMKNDELPALLNSADIFVYPSVPFGGWEEQFGYAMAEASACGVPVIATNTGSIEEVVINGQSGILVRPDNPQQLADAIHKILSDDNLRKEMGKSGREYIIETFDHRIIANKIKSFLSSFLPRELVKK